MSTLSKLLIKRLSIINQLKLVDQEIEDTRKELHNRIKVVKRQASVVVFDEETGEGVVSCDKNSYGEYKIYQWNGKKGALIKDGFRGNAWALRDWFVFENYKDEVVAA